MGNHEYCTRCGESDFHMGKTCEEAYPRSLKKHQATEKKLKEDQESAREDLRRLAKAIEKTFKIKARMEYFEGKEDNLIIHFWDAQKARKNF